MTRDPDPERGNATSMQRRMTPLSNKAFLRHLNHDPIWGEGCKEGAYRCTEKNLTNIEGVARNGTTFTMPQLATDYEVMHI
jgi:hypothetical protein